MGAKSAAAPALGGEPQAAPLLEPLLAVHSAADTRWLADAASTAAERGLGALYGLLFLKDALGHLIAARPASSGPLRALAKLREALGGDLTTLRFDAGDRPALASALEAGRAVAVLELDQALPLRLNAKSLQAARRKLGVAEVWLAPLRWSGESWGLLLLLMPAQPPASLAEAELLGQHVAVALGNLREEEEARKRGELDAVRWVYDERRFLEQLRREARRAQRHGRPLSILLLRVENLEELRARYGRFFADWALRQVAGQLADAMRDTDFLGASREDGFAAILVEADQEGARRAEERLIAGLKTLKLPDGDQRELRVDFACSTATLLKDGETAEELVAAGEARLDEAARTPKRSAA